MTGYTFGKRDSPCGDCWDGYCVMNCSGPIGQGRVAVNLEERIARDIAPSYTVTAINGGMVGTVQTITDAYELMAALRKSWPQKHYQCERDGFVLLTTENF